MLKGKYNISIAGCFFRNLAAILFYHLHMTEETRSKDARAYSTCWCSQPGLEALNAAEKKVSGKERDSKCDKETK